MYRASRSNMAIKRELVQPPFALMMGDDNIVRIYTEDSAWITLEQAKKLVVALENITGGIPHLILKIPGRHTINDKEARSYISSGEGLKYSIAEAIVVSNMAQRTMGKLISWIDKPAKPLKVFENEDDAIAWLLRQKTTKLNNSSPA